MLSHRTARANLISGAGKAMGEHIPPMALVFLALLFSALLFSALLFGSVIGLRQLADVTSPSLTRSGFDIRSGSGGISRAYVVFCF
jgi:hypothetical protein